MTRMEIQAFLGESLKSARDIQNGGISTLIDLKAIDLQSREPLPESVFLGVSRNLSALGLLGTALYIDVKRGSLASVPFIAKDGPAYHIGLYLPRENEGPSVSALQDRLDQAVTKYRGENDRRLPGKDGLIVITKEKLELWQGQGLFQKMHRPENFEGGLSDQDRRNGDTLGDNWLAQKYLIALVKAAVSLPRSGFSIDDLARNGELVRKTSDFITVKFNDLINTEHTPSQREWDFARDGKVCGFDGTEGSYDPRELFTPEELIILYERSLEFRPPSSHNLVGRDLSGVTDERLARHMRRQRKDLGDYYLPACNARLRANYEYAVDSGLGRLTPDNVVGDYHHIIPRGAFFTLLMLVSLENPEMGRWINEAPIDQVVLWARGIKISTVMKKMRKCEHWKIEDIAKLCINNVKRWDQIVNSNDNTISLCKKCHRRIIHPDMRYVEEICGFIIALARNKIPLIEVSSDLEKVSEEEKLLASRILVGEFKQYAGDINYGLQMLLIHACRTAVMGYGSNYWAPSFSDHMHDRVRHRSKAFLRELDKEEWAILQQKGLPVDQAERNALARYWGGSPAKRHLSRYSPKRKNEKLVAVASKWQIEIEDEEE